MKTAAVLRRGMACLLALGMCIPAACAQEAPELLEPVGVQMDTFTARVETIDRLTVYDAAVIPWVEELSFPLEGKISQIHVGIGQQVSAGDVLMTLDQAEEMAQMESIEGQLQALEEEQGYREQLYAVDMAILETELALLHRGGADETAMELKKLDMEERRLTMEMETALHALEAEGLKSKLAVLEEKVSHHALRAPFDGRVMHMTGLAQGDWVSANTPLIFLADDSRMLVRSAFIAGAELSAAHEVYALIGAGRYALEPVALDPQEYVARTLAGETAATDFFITAPGAEVTVGAYAAVCVQSLHAEGALVVPGNAIFQDAEGRYLYVVEDGVRIRRRVETGAANDMMMQITAGLEEGEIVYVKE